MVDSLSQLADPAFRRQILVQVLILIQYLLACTPAARAKALPVANAAAFSPFILSPENVSSADVFGSPESCMI